MGKKDVAFKIRIQSELRQEFVETCSAQDRSAAQVIREFMRSYISQHYAGLQQPLLPNGNQTTKTS
jgi:hypothetical protein